MKSFTAVVAFASLLVYTTASECTPKSFRGAAKQCTSQFFDEITTDKKLNCSLAYQTLVHCIKEEEKNCWKRCSSEWTPQEISTQAWGYISNEEHFCERGMMNSFAPRTVRGCNKEFYRKAREISRHFHETFQEGRNSSKLCGLFTKAKYQMKECLQSYCSSTKEVTHMISQYADTYNPYCKKGKSFLERRSGPRCTYRSYEKRRRFCIAKFVHILKENGGKDCTSAFRRYESCHGATLRYCYKGYYNNDEELRQMVNESLARGRDLEKHLLCDGANLGIPLGQCTKDYRKEIQRCDDTMVQTFRANRADPSLCRKYANAKICAKSVIKAMCNMTENMKAYVEFYYDNFNPFCSDTYDPELTPTRGGDTTKNHTTSQANTANPIPPVYSLLGLVVIALVF